MERPSINRDASISPLNLSDVSNETSEMAPSLVYSFGNGSYASIEERFVLPGNRGDFSQKDIVNESRRSYGRMMVYGWCRYETAEVPGCSRWNNAETEAVLPYLGALKK